MTGSKLNAEGRAAIVRYPWFANKVQRIVALIPGAVRHYTITQNYGRLGGYLECEFWSYSDGSPTGLTISSWRSER
jgi:hypothetical protein